jgi:hypothetical protein
MNIIPKDLVLEKINAGWNDSVSTKEFKTQAKWLRLLVNHVKTHEGVPREFQGQVREWVNHLIDALGDMDEGCACQCVSSIDHAVRKLDTEAIFGEGLKAQLDPAERRRITRSLRPIKLRASGSKSEKPAISHGDDGV